VWAGFASEHAPDGLGLSIQGGAHLIAGVRCAGSDLCAADRSAAVLGYEFGSAIFLAHIREDQAAFWTRPMSGERCLVPEYHWRRSRGWPGTPTPGRPRSSTGENYGLCSPPEQRPWTGSSGVQRLRRIALRPSSGLADGSVVRGRRAHRRIRERGSGLPAVRRVRTRLCRRRRGQHGLKPQPAQSCPVALPAGRGELRRPPMTIAGTPRPARGRERIPIEEECHDRQPDG
jgi:hypothetical protein